MNSQNGQRKPPSQRPGSSGGSRGSLQNSRARSGASVQRGAQGERQASASAAKTNRSKSKSGKSTAKRIGIAILRFIAACFCIGVMLVSVLAVLVSLYLVDVTQNDDQLLDLNNLKLSYSSTVYVKDTATGEWVEYQKLVGEENRVWKDLGDMPDNLKNAFIAAEDQNFRTHNGVSIKRTIFAVLNELSEKLTGSYLGGQKQGASTIDQQLVKNILNDDESNGMEGYLRKVREIFRAYMLDKKYGKDIILEAYLNTLSLTGNKGGVEVGAQDYFGKSVDQLTLAECASIACITKNPTAYNPRTQPAQHIARRNYVLRCMLDSGVITEEEYNQAVNTPLVLVEPNRAGYTGETVYSWFTDHLINEVLSDYMEQHEGMTSAEASRHLYNDGWKIYSTMVPEVQNAMESVMQNNFHYGDIYPDKPVEITETDAAGNPILDENGQPKTHVENVQAAIVSLNYKGEVVGMVGGLGEKTGMREFNRASDMTRQIGSTMKPIGAYALGIELDKINYSFPMLDDWVKEIPDEKGGMKQWPRNYNGTYTETTMLVCDALAKSINTVAVRTLMSVGADTSYEFVHDILKVESLVDSDRGEAPMALGATTYGVKPIELAGAYMMFGNGGTFTTPHSYISVEDRNGDVILEPTVTSIGAISEETAMIMNKMLYNVVHGGTANGLWVRDNMDSVGKTGTTNDDKDHWFVGLTPYYVTAAWMGYDTPTELNWRTLYSTHPPTLTWRSVMEQAQENLPFAAFPTSDNVVTITYCKQSGAVAGPNCPETATGYYKKDGLLPPSDTCPIHG